VRCPYCNSELNNDYCPKCGKKVYAPGNPIETVLSVKKKKSGVLSIFIMLVLICAFVFVALYTMNSLKEEDLNFKKPDEEKGGMVSILSEYGVPKYLSGDITNVIVRNESDVYQVLEELSSIYKFSSPRNEFDINISESEGITYYRLIQLYGGIRVYGQELVVSVDKNGKVLSITGEYVPSIDIKNYSSIKDNEASNIVKEDFGDGVLILSREKVVVPFVDGAREVYLIYASNDKEIREYVVDAINGNIINIDDDVIDNINYKYSSEYLDNDYINLNEYHDVTEGKLRYQFLDTLRNIEIIDGTDLLIMNNSKYTPLGVDMENGSLVSNSVEGDYNIIEDAVISMKAFEDIYDYYKYNLGSSVNKKLSVFINANKVSDDNINAHYNKINNQIFIGSYNNSSLSKIRSLVYHEYNHSVINNISALGNNLKKLYVKTEENQSGALNEAYSDILSLIIDGKSWIMASNSDVESIVGRDLSNPQRYLKPSKINGENYYPSNSKSVLKYLEDNNMDSLYEFDNGGVHINSTVVGYAAYLSYKNGAYVDLEEMAKVWYNSLYMLSPTSKFEDAALAVVKTAENLGLDDEHIEIIKSAFYETNILDSGSFKLSGVVSSNGTVLSNVKVSVVSINNNSEKLVKGTNKEGKYEFISLPSGIYEVTFSKSGYNDVVRKIEINEDTTIDVQL